MNDKQGETAGKKSSPSGSQPEEKVGGTEGSAEKAGDSEGAEAEYELSAYPLREPSEDPRWAIRTVWVWIGFGLASLIFILTLLVLGSVYD